MGKTIPESSIASEAVVASLDSKTDSSNECLLAGEKPKARNRNNPSPDRIRSDTRYVGDDVLTSNILFHDIWVTRVSLA